MDPAWCTGREALSSIPCWALKSAVEAMPRVEHLALRDALMNMQGDVRYGLYPTRGLKGAGRRRNETLYERQHRAQT